MANILGRLVGSKGPSRELRDALKALLLESQDLFDQAVGHVHDGSTPEVLMALDGRDTSAVNSVMGAPGSATSYRWVDQALAGRTREVTGSTPDQISAARSDLYEVDGSLTIEQEVRLARLLTAIATDVEGAREGVPAWLTVLVNDVATSAAAHQRCKHPAAGRRERWTPEHVERVAREGGVADPVTTTIRVLLEDPAPSSWRDNPLAIFHTRADLESYLVEHRAETTVAVPKLSAAGRTVFLKIVSARLVPTFVDVVASRVADPAKGVRKEAGLLVAKADEKKQVELLAPLLLTAPSSVLGDLADRIAALPGGAPAIEERLAQVKGARAAALTKALDRAKVLEAPVAAIEVPPFETLAETDVTDDLVQVGEAAAAETIARAEKTLAEKGLQDPHGWQRKNAQRQRKDAAALSGSDFRRLGEVLRGADGAGSADDAGVRRAALFVTGNHLLSKVPGATLLHRLRLAALTSRSSHFSWYHVVPDLTPDIDLRAIAEALHSSGLSQAEVDGAVDAFVFSDWHWIGEPLEPAAVWPYYAERLQILERHLAGVDNGSHAAARALAILSAFPAVPAELLPRVTSLALGEGKTYRHAAQMTLEAHPGVRLLAEQGLSDSKTEIRTTAAVWVQRLGDPESLPALRTALAKEKREVVRAALLSALEALGEDISEHLSPERLLAEASKGLKAKPPASMSWFPYAGLPQVAWADGTPVPPEVVRWWAVLAVKLKAPSGAGLIQRYVSLLDAPSRASLGRFALSAWIAQDTLNPTQEESRVYAEERAQSSYDSAQKWIKQRPGNQWAQEQAALSVEDHYRAYYRSHQATYLGSATADKGLLALTVGMPGGELATAVQRYLKTHNGRRSQAESLVRALAANGEQAAIQLLLAISRRFKQASVQEVARGLAEQLAEDRGWTADQLADRTIQTAGFDDDGVLRLDLGNRVITGRITEKFTLELSNAEGKVIKALPATRADDDPELYKAAKAQLSASRKELKAVVALQTARLYEAMCTGRTWTAEEFTEYVTGHPVMSRLAARLVWVSDPGTPTQRAFRPGDGALIDADDEDVTLTAGGQVGLAHAVTLGAEAAATWREHLVDYQVAPLFDQLDGVLPEIAAGATLIDDHKGWLTDSFSIRGRATKLGYVRSAAEDAGWFTAYCKPYPSVGLRVDLEFTGAYLPEENIAAAMTDLVVVRTDRKLGTTGRVPLAEVPTVLLAEAYRDYVRVAEAGSFDADWARKSSY